MPICFIEIPTIFWTNQDEGQGFQSLFRQLRLSENRISAGVNTAVERKRHHKICTVIEDQSRKLVSDGKAEISLEFPLTIATLGKIPSSSYLQLSELIMVTRDVKLTAMGAEVSGTAPSSRESMLEFLSWLYEFFASLFRNKTEIQKTSDAASLKIPFDPTAVFETENYWLSRFCDTPEEIPSKCRLFNELRRNPFERYFGMVMESEITGYKPMLENLSKTYESALKNGAGVVVVVNVDVL